MTQTTIYRPSHDVQSIESQDELNDLLRAGKLETKLVNHDEETLAAYYGAYWVHNVTDLIGFDKKEILKLEKAKAKAGKGTQESTPVDSPEKPLELQESASFESTQEPNKEAQQ
jgi:hypothetical protein